MTSHIPAMHAVQAHRAESLHFVEDPAIAGTEAFVHHEDGVIVVDNGHIAQFGAAADVLGHLPDDVPVIEHPNALLVPGLVDTHVHYPQLNVIASYGTQLLEWLETHTFPEERKFADKNYAAKIAERFLDELLNNGTTTALVFGTVHPESVEAFFEASQQRNLRMICGKVMMDRNAPDWLLDTPESAFEQSRDLIKRWHNKDRLGYAITPRFAPTSSAAQLQAAADLREQFPDVMIHTHLAENPRECEWVEELFPDSRSYLDVYQQFGLLGSRSVFAHSLYLDATDWAELSKTDSVIAHCPTSNLFIGSGLFDLQTARNHGVRVGLGTDVGGGDSLSLLRTINEAYKVQQLQGQNLPPYESLYMATLGGARALSLESKIGNFETGKEADFITLDYKATPLIKSRLAETSLLERLFALQMLGDERCIRETWIMGEAVRRFPN